MNKSDKAKKTKEKFTGLVLDLDEIKVYADANQYILTCGGKTYHYVVIEHLLEDMFEIKRKEFAVAGKDKTIQGFIEATLKAKEWMEKAVEIKYKNPYESWRKDKEYRKEHHL